LRYTKIIISIFFLLFCSAPVCALGFSFSGGGREFPYPNEPQYQYPGKDDLRKYPHGSLPTRADAGKSDGYRTLSAAVSK
jgi:hypothetical protein